MAIKSCLMNEMHDLRNLRTCSKKQKTTNINDISTEKNKIDKCKSMHKKKWCLKDESFFKRISKYF